MTRHRKHNPSRRAWLYFPSLRILFGCSGGRILWFPVAYMTGDPMDEQ